MGGKDRVHWSGVVCVSKRVPGLAKLTGVGGRVHWGGEVWCQHEGANRGWGAGQRRRLAVRGVGGWRQERECGR